MKRGFAFHDLYLHMCAFIFSFLRVWLVVEEKGTERFYLALLDEILSEVSIYTLYPPLLYVHYVAILFSRDGYFALMNLPSKRV